MYDIGLFTSRSFPNLRVISVGNLAVGGTGKTPMVEYLIRKGLESHVSMAVLSRGYGRQTKGVRIAGPEDTAADLGDESYGYYLQYGEKVRVVVAEKRVLGLETIEQQFPNVRTVILDDAFQHRAVKPDFSVLLTQFSKPFWTDHLMPAGRLREARLGYQRSDAIILTKCPENQIDKVKVQLQVISEMKKHAAATGIRYGALVQKNGSVKSRVIALAGLADNRPFFEFVNALYDVVDFISFPDHKKYRTGHLERIVRMAAHHEAMILTTFKDAVKLKELTMMQATDWGYLPIETVFLAGEAEFLKNVTPFLNPPLESVDHP